MPRISLAVSVTAVLKVVVIESKVVFSLLMMVRGANLPPIIAWKISNTLGSFNNKRQRKDTRFSSVEKRINTSMALDFLFTRTS